MTTKNEDGLTPRQRRTLPFVISTPGVAEAARQANVSERTLRRWMDDPAFTRALQGAELAVVNTTTRRLTGMAEAALETVQAVMVDASASATARLRAAEIVLNQMEHLREMRDLEQRLTALEQLWTKRHDGGSTA
jgi:hypothetical protein